MIDTLFILQTHRYNVYRDSINGYLKIGFIDFIVEPTMIVCGEMLTKMVEPLVSLPASDTLFPPPTNNDGREGSVSGASLSPLPDA